MLRPSSLLSLVALSALAAACEPSPAATPPAAFPGAPPPPPPATAAATPAPPPPAPAATSSYDKPPPDVLQVLTTPSPPRPVLNPTRDAALLVTWVDYPGIARVAEPFLKLAGMRVEPRNHSNHSTPGGYGIAPCASDYVLVRVPDGASTRVALPAGACASSPLWSADGKHFAFKNVAADTVQLWVGDGTSREVHQVPGVRVNEILGSSLQWMADQRTLLVKLVPANLGAPPPEPTVPSRPNIQETGGEKGQSSTYEARDVLKSPHDEDLFDYYAASQLALVDAASGTVTPIGAIGLYEDVDAAPGGEHIQVDGNHRPYSYIVTADRFPRSFDVWDRAGKPVRTVAQIPLADRVPVHGVRTGPRDFEWRQNAPATLMWAEALDGGDWNAKVPARDKVMTQAAPFSAAPAEIGRTEQRFEGLTWGEQGGFALMREVDENRHWTRTFVVDVDAPSAKPQLLWDLSTDEHYKDPGWPVMRSEEHTS